MLVGTGIRRGSSRRRETIVKLDIQVEVCRHGSDASRLVLIESRSFESYAGVRTYVVKVLLCSKSLLAGDNGLVCCE